MYTSNVQVPIENQYHTSIILENGQEDTDIPLKRIYVAPEIMFNMTNQLKFKIVTMPNASKDVEKLALIHCSSECIMALVTPREMKTMSHDDSA